MSNVARSTVPTLCVPAEGRDFEIGAIVAMGLDRAIGQKGGMPWNIPGDLVHFKDVTLNSCVIMGRRTFESIGRPLPRRRNIVISHDLTLRRAGVEVTTSLDLALALAEDRSSALEDQKELRYPTIDRSALNIVEYHKIFVIGGARLFHEIFESPRLQKVYLTELRATFPDADTFLPEFDLGKFKEVKNVPERGYYLSRAVQPEGVRQIYPEGEYFSQKYEEWREIPENPMPFRFIDYQRIAD